MALLADRAFVDSATATPALREVIRDAVIEALFTRNDRVLPAGIVARLGRQPAVTVKVKSDAEAQKLIRVANGQESTVSLGLPAEDFHYVRRQLEVSKDRDIGIVVRPRVLTTHAWILPPQGGIEVDTGDLAKIEVDAGGNHAVCGVGAPWKALFDEAAREGRIPRFFPLVPLDYAIGDALCGDAVFQSYRGPFRRDLIGVRSFASHGRRARVGFDEVTNHGTGYDLLGLMMNSLPEFVLPVGVSVALAPRARVTKNLVYHYPDAGKLAEALGKLTASGRSVLYANVYDVAAWQLLHPGAPGGPLVLEIGFASSPGVAPVREKGVDTLLAGFTSKAADVASPYDAEARLYGRTGERIGRRLCPGYVTVPAKGLPAVWDNLRGVAGSVTAKVAVFGAFRRTGGVSLAPMFDAPKDLPKVYRISKAVWEIVRGAAGASYLSRLAQVWANDPMYRQRIGLLQKLKAEIDSAKVFQPAVAAA